MRRLTPFHVASAALALATLAGCPAPVPPAATPVPAPTPLAPGAPVPAIADEAGAFTPTTLTLRIDGADAGIQATGRLQSAHMESFSVAFGGDRHGKLAPGEWGLSLTLSLLARTPDDAAFTQADARFASGALLRGTGTDAAPTTWFLDAKRLQVVSNGAAASAAYDGPYYREDGEKLTRAGDLAFEARGIPVTAPKQPR